LEVSLPGFDIATSGTIRTSAIEYWLRYIQEAPETTPLPDMEKFFQQAIDMVKEE